MIALYKMLKTPLGRWTGLALPLLALMLFVPSLYVAADPPSRPLAGFTPTPAAAMPTPLPGQQPTPVPAPKDIDLVITKRADRTEAQPGQEATFVIEAINRGERAAVDVVITDVLSEYLEVVQVTTSQGTVTITGQKVKVDVGVLGPGFVVEILIQVRLRDDLPVPQRIENVAHLDSPNGGERLSLPITISVPGPLVPETGGSRTLWPASVWVGLLLLSAGLIHLRLTWQHARLSPQRED
jgi:uncharacterized repeat protein (TIGR01451 family)